MTTLPGIVETPDDSFEETYPVEFKIRWYAGTRPVFSVTSVDEREPFHVVTWPTGRRDFQASTQEIAHMFGIEAPARRYTPKVGDIVSAEYDWYRQYGKITELTPNGVARVQFSTLEYDMVELAKLTLERR